jgi:hypothetical protein
MGQGESLIVILDGSLVCGNQFERCRADTIEAEFDEDMEEEGDET